MQVANSMRRMRILEQEVENDTESVDYLTLQNEILEQSFYFLSEGVVNGICLNKQKCNSNENIQYYELHICAYVHIHSMYCSMSIEEFKDNLEKLILIL